LAKFRRKASRRYGFRRASRSRRSSGSGITWKELLVGMAGYAVVRPYIANVVPDFEMLGDYSDNVVLGVGGGVAAWKGSGMIKKAGIVVAASETLIGVSKLTSGITNGSKSSGYVYG